MTTRVLWGVALASALLLAVGARLDVGANDADQTPVLVAKQLIPLGTAGERVVAREMYDRTTVPLSQVENGAIADPAYLCGRVTSTEVFPGKQLTAASFGSGLPSAAGSGDRPPGPWPPRTFIGGTTVLR